MKSISQIISEELNSDSTGVVIYNGLKDRENRKRLVDPDRAIRGYSWQSIGDENFSTLMPPEALTIARKRDSIATIVWMSEGLPIAMSIGNMIVFTLRVDKKVLGSVKRISSVADMAYLIDNADAFSNVEIKKVRTNFRQAISALNKHLSDSTSLVEESRQLIKIMDNPLNIGIRERFESLVNEYERVMVRYLIDNVIPCGDTNERVSAARTVLIDKMYLVIEQFRAVIAGTQMHIDPNTRDTDNNFTLKQQYKKLNDDLLDIYKAMTDVCYTFIEPALMSV